MEKWAEMSAPRQQLGYGHCVEAFRECVGEDLGAGLLGECRKAGWACIALAMDKMVNRNSLFTRWNERRAVVESTFDSHDFGFKWSYAEMIIAGPFGYGLKWGP